jgi:hypothetical protein
VQRSLPEMNEANAQKKLPFPAYAFHRGGQHEKADKILAGKDAKGNEWTLDFVWSTPEFEKQFGGIKGLPSYYLIDKKGFVKAVIKGHPKDTLGTLAWLAEQLDKQAGAPKGYGMN